MAKNKGSFTLMFLRVVLGLIFVNAGYSKLFVTGGFSAFVDMLKGLGIPLAAYMALLVAAIELIGGLFLIFGVATKLSSFLLGIIMLVAFFKVHMSQGFRGYRLVLLIFAALMALYSHGAGKWSLAKILKSKWME